MLPRPQDPLSPIYASRQHFSSSCGFSPDQATSLTFSCQDLTGRSLSYQGKQPSAEIEGASPARVLVSWWFPTSSMGETVSSAARSTCWRPHRHQPICRTHGSNEVSVASNRTMIRYML
ncbi:uncharacterized protein LOC119318059 isoform X1 [Triticum dicoccoides]|uniref:uncharacterized protein LOC119318059 isoform X1 n=1 Tax=Triticum dicoccoides TaxID=85692 RepID=UPI001890C8DB|nr:uncharacterized protein LOC119318059 isoform X1 [Triticum dicoccoides]